MITSDTFEKFTVFHDTDAYQFKFITITADTFYADFSKYILDFQMIKRHANINLGIGEELSLQDYNNIYERLINFIDFERIYDIASLDSAIIEILDNELIKDSELRRDKWGRIGEYIFNIILDSYFNLDCIIRKFALNTSRNMSVYGIDTVHCSLKDKTLYFGESKMVDSIENGVSLIKKSLASYEAQISEEYYTIKNNNFTRSDDFLNIFGDDLNHCLNFSSLIKRTGINKIGIPIFVSHGGTYKTEEVFLKMRTIKQVKMFGLDTIYYLISVPVIDKERLRQAFVTEIREKIRECEQCIMSKN